MRLEFPLAGVARKTVHLKVAGISQKLSSKWWDENGEFGLMNPVQLDFVRQKLLEAAYDDGTIRPVHIIHSVDCKYLMSVAEVSCLG